MIFMIIFNQVVRSHVQLVPNPDENELAHCIDRRLRVDIAFSLETLIQPTREENTLS